MKVVWGRNPQDLVRLSQAVGFEHDPKLTVWASVVTEDGRLAAVAAFYHFSATDCELTVATFLPRALTRKTLPELFGYPFRQLSLRRMTAITHPENASARKVLTKAGFRVEGLLRNRFGNEPGILFGIIPEECKWLAF